MAWGFGQAGIFQSINPKTEIQNLWFYEIFFRGSREEEFENGWKIILIHLQCSSAWLMLLHLKVIKLITLVLCWFERGPFSNFGEQLVNAPILPHYATVLVFSESNSKRHLNYYNNGAIVMDAIMIQNCIEDTVPWSCMVVHYRNPSKFPQTKWTHQAQLPLRQVNDLISVLGFLFKLASLF